MRQRRVAAPLTGASRPARPSRRPIRLTALILALGLPGAAWAVRIDYELGGSILHSDNIRLAEFDSESDTVVSPQLRFDIQQTGSTLELSAKGGLQYLHFVDDTFDNDLRGDLAGSAKWTISPERLTLIVQDTLSRDPISVLGGVTFGNQQQTNVFEIGPTLHARLGERTRGQVDVRYFNTYAEENKEFNSNRYNLSARVLHDIDVASSISGNLEATRVDYGNEFSDYSRFDGFVGYAKTLKDFDLNLDVGYTHLDHRDGRTDSEPLTRASLDWRIEPRHTLTTAIAFQISDATQDITARTNRLDGPLLGDITAADVFIGPVVYKQSRVDASYRYSGDRITFAVSPYYERIRYLEREDSTGRQLYRGGVVSLGYRIRPTLDLQFVGAQTRRQFDDIDRTDRDSIMQASLLNEISHHWSWRIDALHRERDSSALSQSYKENAVVFSVTFRR